MRGISIKLRTLRRSQALITNELVKGVLIICVQIIKLILCRQQSFHIITRQISKMLLLEVIKSSSKFFLLFLISQPDFLLLPWVISEPTYWICKSEKLVLSLILDCNWGEHLFSNISLLFHRCNWLSCSNLWLTPIRSSHLLVILTSKLLTQSSCMSAS